MALAQRDLGTITGIISDPQGAAVPNAKVTITEDATGLTYDVQTNSAGEYIRPLLKPGTYTVTAEAAGFSPPALAAPPKQTKSRSHGPGARRPTPRYSIARD